MAPDYAKAAEAVFPKSSKMVTPRAQCEKLTGSSDGFSRDPEWPCALIFVGTEASLWQDAPQLRSSIPLLAEWTRSSYGQGELGGPQSQGQVRRQQCLMLGSSCTLTTGLLGPCSASALVSMWLGPWSVQCLSLKERSSGPAKHIAAGS